MLKSERITSVFLWLALLGVIIASSAYFNRLISSKPNADDALQNVEIALALARTGRFASSSIADPTMYREPLPIFGLAAQLLVDPRLAHITTLEGLNEGPAIRSIKQNNLIWLAAALFGMTFLSRQLIGSRTEWFVASLLAVMLAVVVFPGRGSLILDNSYTELHAAAILIWTAGAAVYAIRHRSAWSFFAVGMLLGAVVLTKAIFLYIAPVFLLVLMLVILAERRDVKGRVGLCTIAAVVGLTLAVGPWLARNEYVFGKADVSDRGGIVLRTRAVKNQMSDDEWRGALYAYSPGALRNWLGRHLGYSSDDLELGGRLQRLNRSVSNSDMVAEKAGRPEDAISFYRLVRAERVQARREAQERGSLNPGTEADAELHQRAVRSIVDDPVSHIATTPVFFWRSLWVLSDRWFIPPIVTVLLTIAGVLTLWGLCLWGLIARKPSLFAAFGLFVGMMAAHALVTHGIPRYSFPAVPGMLVALSFTVVTVGSALMRTVRRALAARGVAQPS